MPSLANLRRHFDAVRSVQSSRAAISWSLNPSPANSTILARITSRYGRVYWPARRTNSRPSLSLIATAAIADEVRRRYSNSFKPRRTYFREPVLAVASGYGTSTAHFLRALAAVAADPERAGLLDGAADRLLGTAGRSLWPRLREIGAVPSLPAPEMPNAAFQRGRARGRSMDRTNVLDYMRSRARPEHGAKHRQVTGAAAPGRAYGRLHRPDPRRH